MGKSKLNSVQIKPGIDPNKDSVRSRKKFRKKLCDNVYQLNKIDLIVFPILIMAIGMYFDYQLKNTRHFSEIFNRTTDIISMPQIKIPELYTFKNVIPDTSAEYMEYIEYEWIYIYEEDSVWGEWIEFLLIPFCISLIQISVLFLCIFFAYYIICKLLTYLNCE